jgi:hypothetical protein
LGKLNNTAALGTSAVKENLSKLDLTGCLEEFNQILIRSRPGQLNKKRNVRSEFLHSFQVKTETTYVSNHNLLARFSLRILMTSKPTATAAAAAIPTTSASTVTIHPQSTTYGGSLLIRTRIVGVQFRVREIAATTRL